MSISLDGVASVPEPQSVEYDTGERTTLGKDAFLKLLVAQMQNQDPLEPQSNEQFIQQLAQLTQVEELMDMNKGFESIFMALNSMNNSSMTQLLGTQVVAYGNQFHYSGEGDIDIHYQANVETSACKMIVKDEGGSVVWAGPVENLESGEGSFSWSGEDFDGNPLEEGNYTFSLEGTTSDGTPVEINEIMVGVVDGMSYLEGIPQPSISGIQFDLSMVLRVEMVEKEE
jgi:flagellar basal-body rod modification protein FlgD